MSIRSLFFTFCFSLLVTILWGQTDTTIYKVVAEMPRFPGCEQIDTTLAAKNQCAQANLLNFIYSNVNYPMEARQNGNEGTVVLSFVVEPDSTISDPTIVKDIGGGCGLEAMRVVSQMNAVGVRWSPGMQDGKPVRVQFNLPIKFKLEEALPYVLVSGDTIYTELETQLTFNGGDEALANHLNERLDYPEEANDSCLIGLIDIQIVVMPDSEVRILDLTDYNGLGFDFWYEAIDAATSTYNKWTPATYEGRAVPAAYDLSLSFSPTAGKCQGAIDLYDQASKLANEGLELFNAGEKETGIAKLSEAVEMFPNDANFLSMRGQAYLNENQFAEACSDLTLVKRIALVGWFDSVLSFICKEKE